MNGLLDFTGIQEIFLVGRAGFFLGTGVRVFILVNADVIGLVKNVKKGKDHQSMRKTHEHKENQNSVLIPPFGIADWQQGIHFHVFKVLFIVLDLWLTFEVLLIGRIFNW